jgi:putative phosphoesterase
MIGVVSDIHGNYEALISVMSDMPEVDSIFCCGDIVGYGPSPRKCVEYAMNNFDKTVKGNHEEMLLKGEKYNSSCAREGLLLSQERLYSKHYNWINNLSEQVLNRNIHMIHSHPEEHHKRVHEEDIREDFSKYMEREILLYGHIHVPIKLVFENSLVVNPGSVGQPRDGISKASYALIKPEKKEAEIRRVEYEIGKTIEKAENRGLPESYADRLRAAE